MRHGSLSRKLMPLRPNAWVAAAIVSLLIALGGCRTIITTATYLIKGPHRDPKYDILEDAKKKKVAVVVRPLGFASPNADKELARAITRQLSQRLRKPVMVPSQDVENWLDNNLSWETFEEVGRGVDADYVLGIELQNISLRESQVLFKGRAEIYFELVNCATRERLVEEQLPELQYPPNMPIQASETNEHTFRRHFVDYLAHEIGKFFYSYDPQYDYSRDVDAMSR